MNEIKFAIDELSKNLILLSFIHPLTQKNVRRVFKSKKNAQSSAQEIEKYFHDTHHEKATLEQLLHQFIQAKNKKLFRQGGKIHLIDFLNTFGKYPLQEINPTHFALWFKMVQRENSIKDTTMVAFKSEFNGFFTYLVKKGLLPYSPLESLHYKRPRASLESKNILSKHELEHLLKELKAHAPDSLYLIIKVFMETGAKRAEVLNLRWEDLDLEKRKITLGNPKKKRAMSISIELADILKSMEENTTPFTNSKGKKLEYYQLQDALKKFSSLTFVKKWKIQDLRDSFAVHFLRDGGDPKRLKEILGYSNLNDLKKMYREVIRERS